MVALALATLVALSGTPKATGLKIEVKPGSAVVYVDGKRRGTGAKPVTVTLSPGRHVLRVTNKGDEHQELIVIKKGEMATWQWAFEDDRLDRKAASAHGEESSSR